MRRRGVPLLAMTAVLMALGGAPATSADTGAGLTRFEGNLADGASYVIDVPGNWNGTLLLYSRGAQFAGNEQSAIPNAPHPAAELALDPFATTWMLDHGYALAGGSYPFAGYEPAKFVPSQILVLDKFDQMVGKPRRTIAWGHSVGGTITADLVQSDPSRFSGALSMCGFIAGSIGRYNERLDHAFILKVLLGFNKPLVNIGFGGGQGSAFAASELQLIMVAQQTAQGRARFALAEAMVNTPDWFDTTASASIPEPAPGDYLGREQMQYLWAKASGVYQDAGRNELEARVGTWQDPSSGGDGSVVGGNFSWNTGVDYRQQLQRSGDLDIVTALYGQAGLDLNADLDALNRAPRIGADPGAVSKMEKIDPIFSGDLGGLPVLTMHALGDGIADPTQADAYAQAAIGAGDASLLRQVFVARGFHCEFTSAETIAAFQALIARLDSGAWPSIDAASLNAQASALGPLYNKLSVFDGVPTEPHFVNHVSPPFPRPFDTRSVNPYP